MDLVVIQKKDGLSETTQKHFEELKNLLNDLRERPLSEDIKREINAKLVKLNNLNSTEAGFSKQVAKTKSEILDLLQKKLKMVPQNYYTSLWLSLGMTAFGLPIGAVIFALTGNIAFLAVGLPLGMGLGSFYGMSLDRKAAAARKVIVLRSEI